MILLRKRFPEYRQIFIRMGLIFAGIIITITLVDKLGDFILGVIFDDSYNGLDTIRAYVPIVLASLMVMAIYEAIYHFVKMKESVLQEEQAKQAVVQLQLDALRNQARPHFLFNSLNTLRDIIDQEPKEEAKGFVDRLSNVYRFILDSGSVNLVTLAKELKFAQSYIYIQSERFGENLVIHWDLSEKSKSQLIVPMSLQLLLENAIKHNVISRSKPLNIHVIAVEDKVIVKNEIQPKSTQMPSTKLGLKNIKKRYALISDAPVDVKNDGLHFEVSVPLFSSSDTKIAHADINY